MNLNTLTIMQETTDPSGIAIILAVIVGLGVGVVGAFYTAKALFRAKANDNITVCATIGVFFLGFTIPMLLVLHSSPKKPGQREFERFQAAKKEAQYWGAQMFKQVKAGQEGLAQDSAKRYSAAKEEEEIYWKQYVAELNRTNVYSPSVSTNKASIEPKSP